MLSRRSRLAVAAVALVTASIAFAQTERHGRKYKAPPETTHLEVLVLKDFNGKVIENAGVIFHPTKDGEDEGNLEVKSGVDGKAFIDIIPTGSDVQIQVIAGGFTTYAGNIKLDGPSKQLTIRMKKPTEQVSAYEEKGKDGAKVVGVQEPLHRIDAPKNVQPLPSSAPVISLPSLPKSPAKGDTTVQPKPSTATPAPAAGSTTTPNN